MTRRRWIADRVEGDRAYLLDQNANHLFRVLRVKAGQEFEVVAEGAVRLGTVIFASDDKVEFHLGEEVLGPDLPEIGVYLSVFKFDRMEWALEKLTELGVARLVPVIAARTAHHLIKAAGPRLSRWRKIVHEAAQQSRRVAPPEISEPESLKEVIAAEHGHRIVLFEAQDTVSLKMALSGSRPPLALAFGPEGGWTQEEIKAFQASGWSAASLGRTILRAETAAIAAVAVVFAELS